MQPTSPPERALVGARPGDRDRDRDHHRSSDHSSDRTAEQPSRRTGRLTRSAAAAAALALALTGAAAAGSGSFGPAAAQAADKTPNVRALAGDLAKQKLTWEACDYQDSSINERFGDIPNVQCATVKVPRDWHHPGNGKTWDIRISQAKNIDAKNARYKGTIFVNPGGPGGSGLPWAAAMQERTPDLNPYYNYVGFDPRGVGQSSHAVCMSQIDSEGQDPNEQLRSLGETCSANEDVKTINTEQTTYDMDFIRSLLGAPKLSYIGYSYGTWLGTWYENVFGAKYGDKFLLDSSIDVTQPTLQRTWDVQPVARDRQFRQHLIPWIARNNATYKMGTDAEAIYQKYLKGAKIRGEQFAGFVWSFSGSAAAFSNNAKYPEAARTVAFIASYADEETTAPTAKSAPLSAPRAAATPREAAAQAVTALETLAKQAPSAQRRSELLDGARSLRTASRAATATGPTSGITSQRPAAGETPEEPELVTTGTDDAFSFIRCNDGQWTQGDRYWSAWNAKMAPKYPLSRSWGMFSTSPECAHWRTSNLMPVAGKSFPQTVVLQGELDSQTAWETAYDAGTTLPNTSFVAIDNEGTHGHFPYGTEAVDRPIYDYFLKGTQPKNVSVSQGLPLPGERVTFETWKRLNPQAKHVGAPADGVTAASTAPGTRFGARGGKGLSAQRLAADNALLAAPALRAEQRRLVLTTLGQQAADELSKDATAAAR